LLIRINRQDAQHSDPAAKPATAVRKIGGFIWAFLLPKGSSANPKTWTSGIDD
jgi:hypothetical protein